MKSVYSIMDQMAAAMQQEESLNEIINIAITAEALAVALNGAAVANAANYTNADGSRGLPSMNVTVLKAVQASEQAHYQFLSGAGAKPLTTTFNIPDPKIATDSTTLFRTLETLDQAFVAAYLVAARSFAEMKMPDLVKVAYQIGGVEAEHVALARFALNEPIPHNVAFQVPLFNTLGEAAATLQKLGFIGGSGQTISYNDFAGRVDFTGVTELTPGGPTVTPLMAGMPRTGQGGGVGRSIHDPQATR